MNIRSQSSEGRASLCVFTNRSMPFKTLLAYCTKFYPEAWLAEKQKMGVRLPHPYVLQYEIVISPQDWSVIREELKNVLQKHEVPCVDTHGENDMVWLSCRKGYVIRKLKETVGWRRRKRQQYFNQAQTWRGFWVGVRIAPFVVAFLWWLMF